MKKRCIVLIDFSEYSENLLKYAYSWSKHVNAELLLLHKSDIVLSARLDDRKREDLVQRIISETVEDLRDFTFSTLKEIPSNLSFKVTDHTNIASTISELLKEPYNNLLFVGLKGTGMLKKIFIGSVAIEVIEETDSITVAIPKDVTAFSPTKLLVAVRDEYPLNIDALNKLLGFFGDNVPEVNFFTVVHEDAEISKAQEQLRELGKQFSDKTDTSFSTYKADDFIHEIKKLVNINSKELLVVQKGSRLLKDHLLRKFLINELIYEGKTPLIVLP